MKNIFLYGAFASAVVMLSACSNEDAPVVNGGDLAAAKQEFVLQVSNTGNGLTRAGRPLLSQEGLQTIENVELILCNSNDEVVYVNTIGNWMNASSAYNQPGDYNGQEYKYELKGDDRLTLEEGAYTLYAVGYHTTSDYDLAAIKAIKEGDSFEKDVKVSLKSGLGEELFAGSVDVKVNEEGGFKANVILNRQVAGAYGYFEKVPYFEGATKLQLVSKANLNNSLILGQFMNKDLGNLDADGNKIVATEYAVNGTDGVNGNVVYTINLKDWYGDNMKEATDEEGNGTGIIDTSNWKKPAAYADVFFKKGSVFAGQFLIPFAKDANGGETFELQLVDDNNNVLETWSVSLPGDDAQVKGYPFWSFDGTNWNVATGFKDTTSCYNILRNHLYGIGKRLYDQPDPEDPKDPEDPDPDPDPDPDEDKPEPLNKKQKLTLRVNSNWEVIHTMVID